MHKHAWTMTILCAVACASPRPAALPPDVAEHDYQDVATAPDETVDAAAAESDGATADDGVAADVSVTAPAADAATVPDTLAGRFVAAGGVGLCEAFVFALSPEWGLDLCDRKADAENRAACHASRVPLREFARTICETAVDESLRWNVDAGVVVAILENESNLGKLVYERWRKAFRVGTDVRPPAHRDRGETGICQLLPSEYPRGICVGQLGDDGACLGEKLLGTLYERRAALIARPDWQVRLCVRRVVQHRGWCLDRPKAVLEDYWTWLGSYNTGRCAPDARERWRKWVVYTTRVMRHYLTACSRGLVAGPDGSVRSISGVWSECERVAGAYPRLRRRM